MKKIEIAARLRCGAAPVILAAALVSPAFAIAQDQPQDAQEAGVDQNVIIVTGSRIARPDLQASSPVAVVSAEEIKQTNAVTVEQILQSNPQFAAGFGQSSNNPGDGSATVNLRALEENRTLVLIDGKRAPSYDTTGAVDVNSIPTALLKRVDVLTGGASAVYGSDAIAGVVNFILDDRFKGVVADGSTQVTTRGDGAIYNLSLTGGYETPDGRGNIVVSGGYSKRNGVFYGKRPRLATAIDSYDLVSSGGSSNTVPTAFDIPAPGGRQQVLPDGTLTSNVVPYNFNPVNYAQSPFERWNIMALTRYELSDNIEFYGRGTYSDVKVALQLAPTATAGFSFNIDPSNPFLTPDEQNAFFNTAANPNLQINNGSNVANDPTARAGTSVIGIRRRMIETGGRLENFHTKNKQVLGGFRGDMNGLRWDVFAQYGESKKSSILRNDLSYTALQQALDVVSGPNGPQCFDPSNGCVPLNLFGYNTITPAALAFVLRDATEQTKITQFIAGGSLSGDIGFLQSPMASKPAAFSIGAEYRKETGRTSVDPLYASGDLIYYGQGQNISGKYNVKEIYAELKMPLVQDKPFVNSLGIELGGRYSDYSSVGSVWTYKAGGDWEPAKGYRLRGIYQRAVRAPNIYELYSPVVAGTGGLGVDPCSGTITSAVQAVCQAQGAPSSAFTPGSTSGTFNSSIPQPISGQINIFTGGNPNLSEEKSDTWTIGAVLSPPQLPGFTASVDYFNIKIKGAISDTPPFITIAQCFNNPSPTSAVCQSIVRNTIDGSLSGATYIGVPSTLGNVGAIKTSGVDFTVGYRGGASEGFHYSVNFAGTWTRSYKFQADPTATAEECAGYFGPVCDLEPMPKWKHIAEVSLGWDNISLMARWRYLGKIKADSSLSGPLGIVKQTIDPYSYIDSTISFDIADSFTMRLGVLNLFDKDPPVVGDTTGATASGGSTFPNTYDVMGRSVFAGITAKF